MKHKGHILFSPEPHSEVRYLWRIRCSCGWSAFAPEYMKAKAAGNHHLSEEEPFPDWTEPSPDSEAAKRERES